MSASGPGAAEIVDSYWTSVEARFGLRRQIVGALLPSLVVSDMRAAELPVHERDVAAQR